MILWKNDKFDGKYWQREVLRKTANDFRLGSEFKWLPRKRKFNMKRR